MFEVGCQVSGESKPTVVTVTATLVDASSLPGFVILYNGTNVVGVFSSAHFVYAKKL